MAKFIQSYITGLGLGYFSITDNVVGLTEFKERKKRESQIKFLNHPTTPGKSLHDVDAMSVFSRHKETLFRPDCQMKYAEPSAL